MSCLLEHQGKTIAEDTHILGTGSGGSELKLTWKPPPWGPAPRTSEGTMKAAKGEN